MLTLQKYVSVDNTLENIMRLIERHYTDIYLKVFDRWSLQKIYNYVRNLPYTADPMKVPISDNDNIELLKSPYFTIFTNGGDCDDKAILLGSILRRKKIPFRMAIVTTQQGKDFHHIYLEIYYNGVWRAFDATYPLWDKNHIPSQPFYETPFIMKRVYDWSCGKLVAFDIEYNSPATHQNLPDCNMLEYELLKNKKYRRQFLSGVANDLGFTGNKVAILHGLRGSNLGVDPVTVVATVGAVAKLFTGLFGKQKYQDAYYAWAQAERNLASLSSAADGGNSNAAVDLAANRAIVAILSRDYMNPPLGANVCTSAGRCGNRAEWAVIQPEVEQKAAALTPFFLWYWQQNKLGKLQGNFSLEAMVQQYDDFKQGGPLKQQFNSSKVGGSGSGSFQMAGMGGNTLLIVALLGIAAYMLFK